MSAPDWMLEGCTDMQRDRINRDHRAVMRRGVLGFCRARRALVADHTANKASVRAEASNLDDIAGQLRAINPKLFDTAQGEG